MKTLQVIFIFTLICSINLLNGFFDSEKQKIIIINPAGDFKHQGRKLSNSYEYVITFKIAKSLAQELESRYGMRIIITHTPEESLDPLHNASLSNRMNADFFININVYKQTQAKPEIYLMHRTLDLLADLTKRTHPLSEFIPIDLAHLQNIRTTKSYSERIAMIMGQSDYQKLFDFVDIHGLPIKPLEGIIAPAVLFDIGLSDEETWPMVIDPIAASLKFLLDY